ncbi:hypothetical protein [Streptomyces sp. NK15101]|uniref:hypothetical protein n=1 Tax=Streptomyces sp. NK15101 TaxID=2873261 RepID=UPI001CEC0C23|nr:hypothetical protein [Streptomyces sp. NK15101]
MPVDPYAVLQALLRAEASRARRTERTAPEAGSPAPARPLEPTARTSEPAARREEPLHRDGPLG